MRRVTSPLAFTALLVAGALSAFGGGIQLYALGTSDVGLALSWFSAAPALAEDRVDFGLLALAPAGDTSGGGSGTAAADDERAKEAELATQSLNPIANLISLPIQNNWDFGIGPSDAMKYTVNIQPVIPFSLSSDWNLITRTILPVIYQESRFPGEGAHSGLGDIVQSFFLSPKEPVGGWIVGAGPALLYPTCTDSDARAIGLGSEKWGAGPTIVALQQEKGFTYGLLANHIWSYAGWGDENVSATFLQPFASYTTDTFTSFGMNAESTYDWTQSQWTVPLNFTVTQMLKIGRQPVSLQLGYRYYAEKPEGGPDWGIRFAVTLLFPK